MNAGALQVKLMTFNIRNPSGSGDMGWDNRRRLAVRAIRSFGPDLAGLQEGYESQIQDLLAGLGPSYQSIGVSRYGNTEDEYNNILYRADKYRVLEWGQFWLSDTPDTAGSKNRCEAKYPRICTWAQFALLDDASAAAFYYFNTHLGLAEEAKVQGVHVILERIGQIVSSPRIPVFLGGDFNLEETHPLFRQIESSGLQDTWTGAGCPFDGDGTVHHFEGSPDKEHIDWIFQRNALGIRSIEINRYHQQGKYPSDHYPVQLVIDIPAPCKPAAAL
ncbi:endonuclease/exonuclease/phosphatase family protein [Paenibacillus sp. YN15]|uniref:endonuclease/exonuclease/phosphatase family protein n=1 Tax=Paenibacillus sp. YN15 TaxID=1742774 RepID=UPI000DCDE27E|nr:endonuclease/exonuclease/phosphatase family protein [Paenibacillus sp. YN15]RAV05029.1 hypothetical protein DQG13_03875 [Paenibacillus sp. YN15]